MSEDDGRQAKGNHPLLCLYDAVAVPVNWEAALDALVEASGCVSAILTVSDRALSAGGIESAYEIHAGSQLFRDKATLVAENFQRFGQRELEEFAYFRDAPPQVIPRRCHYLPRRSRHEGAVRFSLPA